MDKNTEMLYKAKDYKELLGTPGFSDQMMTNHFALYEGYVENTNKLGAELESLFEKGQSLSPAYAEIKRRYIWEFNGMKLHEFYFDGMMPHGSPLDKDSALASEIKKNFGSQEKWEKSFRATGAIRGVGWALTMYDPEAQSMFNIWVDQHNVNIPAQAIQLLIMDVWEHAFMLDYGIKRDGYIDAFLKAVDWQIVSNRFDLAAREPAGVA